MTVVKVVIGNSGPGTGSGRLIEAFDSAAAEEKGLRRAGPGTYEIERLPDDKFGDLFKRDDRAVKLIRKGISKFIENGFLQHTENGHRVPPMDIRIEHS